jgi:FSR family fosmidomycin resistance protein-like MFS transporter
LIAACGAHVMHDGFTDLIYVMLPVWQREFGLTFAAVGLLRTLYTGAMATFQMPSSMVGERVGARGMLALGTAFSASCYLVAGSGSTYAALALALFAGGLGSSVQHPISSNMVARAFEGARSRVALGTYNFSGDIGKMALPAMVAGLLFLLPWRNVLWIVGLIGLCVAVAIFFFAPRMPPEVHRTSDEGTSNGHGRTFTAGFSILLAIGCIDSATRMGFLTFLPFVLTSKGATVQTVGLALTILFAGGAAGKFVCGFLGARIGVLATVCLTEGLTALGMLVLLPLSLAVSLAVLPLIGVALNGTSSALYGTVPELVSASRRQRAFGIFYTGTIGAGAIAPVLSGFFSDAYGVRLLILVVGSLVLATIPLAVALQRNFQTQQAAA